VATVRASIEAVAHEPGSSTAELRLDALEHRYGGRRALEPITLEAQGPGILAVTGANGSGKTTLLRILAGLLTPTRGAHELRVAGRAVAPAHRFRAVGLVAVDSSLYDELTARENLELFARVRGLAQPRAVAERGLEHVGLAARANDRVGAYSSGMKQRLKLAFAVQHDPALLLLDEPGSHLDDEGRAALAGVIERQTRRCLVVIATNDEREIPSFARRIRLGGGGLGHSR
jgi:heme exporter protein A